MPADPHLGVRRGSEADEQFLREVARLLAADRPESTPVPPSSDAWVDQARSHGFVNPALAAVRAAGHSLPPLARTQPMLAATASLRQRRDLALLSRGLDEAGVRWVVVKGPVLNQVVYRRSGWRESGDLDVLVHPTDLQESLEALRRLGGEVMGVDWSQRTWARGAEIPVLLPSGTIVDLHWHLINRRRMRQRFAFSPTRLLERRVRRLVGSSEVWTPDDLDVVLHVALHATMDGCGRWRALLDVQQGLTWLAEQGHTPQQLAERAAESRLGAPVRCAVAAVRDELDPAAACWHEALTGRTLWTRVVTGIRPRFGIGPLDHGIVRRLYRYTAPSTAGSIAGVAGYAGERLLSLVVPDRTGASTTPTPPDDPAFVAYLDQVARRAREGSR